MAECEEREVRVNDAGLNEECIGGVWVISPTEPVRPGLPPGQFVIVDESRLSEVKDAVRDPKRQVIAKIVEPPSDES